MIVTGLLFLGLVLGGYVVTEVAGSDSAAASYVNQLGQLAAAVIATAASCVAITRHAGRPRRSWILVALACGSWSIGQLYWCYVVLLQGDEVAQVSIADLFFLAFTALMAVRGLAVRGPQDRPAQDPAGRLHHRHVAVRDQLGDIDPRRGIDLVHPTPMCSAC